MGAQVVLGKHNSHLALSYAMVTVDRIFAVSLEFVVHLPQMTPSTGLVSARGYAPTPGLLHLTICIHRSEILGRKVQNPCAAGWGAMFFIKRWSSQAARAIKRVN